MTEQLTVRTDVLCDLTLVTVSGEIDICTAPALQAALSQVDDSAPVVVDLSDVTFMSAGGLGCLLDAQADGARLLLVCNNRVRHVLDCADVTDEWPVMATRPAYRSATAAEHTTELNARHTYTLTTT